MSFAGMIKMNCTMLCKNKPSEVLFVSVILIKTLKKDKDEKIMDAKVMRKGDQKLIIVDVPNPKQRWMKPQN